MRISKSMSVAFTCMTLVCGAANAVTEFEAMNEICSVARQDASEAITVFDNWRSAPQKSSNQNLRERSREVHNFLMGMERKRIAEIHAKYKRESGLDISSLAMGALDMKSITYRFALCQREKRPSAASTTIEGEAYDRCFAVYRRTIPENHQLCF